MKVLDTSQSDRLRVMLQLVSSLHQRVDASDLLIAFTSAMRRAYGSRGVVQLSTHHLPPGHYRIAQLLRPQDPPQSLVLDPSTLANHPIHAEGILARLIEDQAPKCVHELNLSDDPVVDNQLRDFHSALAVPVYGWPGGLSWVILFDEDPHAFDVKELEDMVLRANLVSTVLGSLQTSQQLSEAHAQIRKQIEEIAAVQQSLLPEVVPQIPGLRIAASYATFDQAGGDLYDFVPLPAAQTMATSLAVSDATDTRRWAILVGDVSGHGPAAAVVMSMVHSILHAYPHNPQGPGEMLTYVNRHLCAKQIAHSFVTAFLAFYDPATRQLTYACAGHNPPLLKDFPHVGPPVHLDAVGDWPLGIDGDVRYTETTVQLRPQQTLILYTDGITEATQPSGEMFGVEGIERSLIHCTGAPECAIRHITDALLQHQSGVRPDDDQTIIAIQVV